MLTSAMTALMKTCSAIISVTTTSEDTTAPVALVTCCTLTTAPAEVRLNIPHPCVGLAAGYMETHTQKGAGFSDHMSPLSHGLN